MLDLVVWGLYAVVLYISFFLLLVFLEKGGLKEGVEWRDEWPSVSVIIPAFNEEETIGMTIESVDSVDYPDYEIIVVNDGSTDGTLEEAEKYEDRVTLIDQENQGKGGALNAGLEEADGELFACVDADSRLTRNSLKNIVSDLDNDMGGIASAMKVHSPDNLLQKMQWVEYMVGIFLRNIMGLVNAIHVTPGPLSIYRTSLVEDLGGFDEDSLVEDQEICFRMQDNQWRVGHSRKGEVYTVAPKNLREFYHQRYRWYRGSLETIIDYRHMFLNPKYGDFGLFGMPTKIAQAFLSILGLFLMSYYVLNPIYSFARDFAVLGLNAINVSLQGITLERIVEAIYWWLISQRFISLVLLGSVFLFSVFMAYLSAIHTEEDVFGYGYLAPITYFFWYVFFIGFMWMVVVIDTVRKGERRW